MLIKTSRRSFLQRLAAAGVASPLVLSLGRKAIAAPGDVKALFLFVPDGVIPNLWHPQGGETGFTLPEMSAALAPVQNDLVFVRGTDMYAGGATHEGGVAKLLTGNGDVSLDVFLGDQIGGDTPFRSIQLGVATTFQAGTPNSISFVGPGQEVKPDDNPLNAFDRLFGQLTETPDTGPDWKTIRGSSVLDSAISELQTLQGMLGAVEREKLEIHLASMRELERNLNGEVGASCSEVTFDTEGFTVSPTDYYPLTYHKEEHFPLMSRLQSELAVLALGCGVTRVATLMWTHAVSPTRVPGTTVANHDASHYGDPASETARQFVEHRIWFGQQLVSLIEKMRAMPDGNGTLLDNSIVFLGTEINDGNLHDHTDMPFVLAGRAGGRLQTGRSLDYRGTNGGENEAHTRLLVSIANMVGVPIDTFGFSGKGPGGLPGLV